MQIAALVLNEPQSLGNNINNQPESQDGGVSQENLSEANTTICDMRVIHGLPTSELGNDHVHHP